MKLLFQSLQRGAVILLLAAFVLSACQKEKISLQQQNLSSDKLSFLSYSDNTIRIHQSITVYDSTQIHDSSDFAQPPSGKYYEWNVISGSGCDSIAGNKNKGLVNFVFQCAGTYLLTADIYDSLTHTLTGRTDTLAVTVTTDTLYPVQNIKPDDILILHPSIVGVKPGDSPNTPFSYYVAFNMVTTDRYIGYTPYIRFGSTSSVTATSYTCSISNIVLDSYPFIPGPYGTTDKVWGSIDLPSAGFGVPVTLTIEWLGITYTGTVSLTDAHTYNIDWDNSGAVIIQ